MLDEIRSVVKYVATAYQQKWDDQVVMVWADALADCRRPEWLQEAARLMVQRHHGIPTVAKLLEHYEEVGRRRQHDVDRRVTPADHQVTENRDADVDEWMGKIKARFTRKGGEA